ncbi:MAG: response regulator [Elusimicrobia bacterium]|nr:response regulator [Elusimicrobiota bacterium]
MPRILIVDDDHDLVQILTISLKSIGHELASANDPATGLDLARRFKPDLILLDYHMPGATGAHLFEAFRRNAATARTPILFMSGEAAPVQVLSEVADPGLSRFISKPVRMADLKRLIDEMLSGPA